MNKPVPVGKPVDPGRQLLCLRFSPDGKLLAAGDFEGSVQRWDAALKPLAPLKGHGGWMGTLAFHPDGRLFSGDS
ncbi:MAG: hypothetical protein K2W96_04655, partial [Gemmataceae bacterium]|nr:hypothetical protein [Gemmataceae bacterium]